MRHTMATTGLMMIISAGVLSFGGCASKPESAGSKSQAADKVVAAPTDARDVETVKALLVGEYDSSAQEARDREYFTITLRMTQCWKERADGPWIYVEQAMSTAQDKPYRQRVYRLVSAGAGKVKSEVYELPGTMEEVQDKFAGQWRASEPLKGLKAEELKLRDGCAITLTKQVDGVWMGSTNEKDCGSTLRGATYATSEVTLSQGLLRSWDRGFDKDGKQVWGAKKGAYEFVKLPPPAPMTPVKKG